MMREQAKQNITQKSAKKKSKQPRAEAGYADYGTAIIKDFISSKLSWFGDQ